MDYVDLAVYLLILHQRKDSQSCLCGWGELGRSHPEHQANVLQLAGVLKQSGE